MRRVAITMQEHGHNQAGAADRPATGARRTIDAPVSPQASIEIVVRPYATRTGE